MGSYLSNLYDYVVPAIKSQREYDEEWVRLRLNRLALYNAEVREANRDIDTTTPDPKKFIQGVHPTLPIDIPRVF